MTALPFYAKSLTASLFYIIRAIALLGQTQIRNLGLYV
jgi:hypothetical protein